MALITCPECKREISDTATSCPHCGYVAPRNQQPPSPQPPKRIPMFAVVIGAVAVLGLIIWMSLPKGPNFEVLCAKAPAGYCTVAPDKRSMTIDTNPSNIKDYFNQDAGKFIKKANSELGLPDSIYEKMLKTRALDGVQTQTSNKITVTWTYHPDNGLEVIYEYTPK